MIWAFLAATGMTTGSAAAGGTAFYYGQSPPAELWDIYDRVVVEPDALAGMAALPRGPGKAKTLAYVSVGELAPDARPAGFSDDWVRGENPAWGSRIMDLSHPEWRRHLLKERMEPLWQQGFAGFFLDTLDSYRLAARTGADRAAQAAALVELIHAANRRFPGAEFWANRGFEVLPHIAPLLRGVVAESLFDGWDAQTGRYVPVGARDRAWLTDRLIEARDRFGLDVTVIDYRPPQERTQARETARRIAALGFAPWVTNAALTMVGVGEPELVPRHILLLYDGARETFLQSAAQRLLVPIIEHLGYVAVPRDVRGPLPGEPLTGRYAGVITWFPANLDRDSRRYQKWLMNQLDAGVRVAIFGHLGLAPAKSARLRARLGLTPAGRTAAEQTTYFRGRHIAIADAGLIGFEAAPAPRSMEGPGLIAAEESLDVALRVSDPLGPLRDPVVTGDWGGMALMPDILSQGYGGETAWVLEPFAFVRRALALEPIPAPDVTTENGRRLVFMHIDGRGADRPAEVRGTPPAREVIAALLTGHKRALPHSTTDAALARALGRGAVLGDPGLVAPGSTMTRKTPWISRLRPLSAPDMAGRDAGPLAVRQPIADEDYFRDNELGYRQVIETLELTDSPRRFLPAGLVVHADAGATAAGLLALETVYGWLATQDMFPVLAREYVEKVRGFYRVVLGRSLDGRTWHVLGGGALRTVRLAEGWPDPSRSCGVVAVHDAPQGRYVSFAASGTGCAGRNTLVVTGSRPLTPLVLGAGGEVLEFGTRPGRVVLRVRGHGPVSLILGNAPGMRCVLRGDGFSARGVAVPDTGFAPALRFDLPVADTGRAEVRCRE